MKAYIFEECGYWLFIYFLYWIFIFIQSQIFNDYIKRKFQFEKKKNRKKEKRIKNASHKAIKVHSKAKKEFPDPILAYFHPKPSPLFATRFLNNAPIFNLNKIICFKQKNYIDNKNIEYKVISCIDMNFIKNFLVFFPLSITDIYHCSIIEFVVTVPIFMSYIASTCMKNKIKNTNELHTSHRFARLLSTN